MRVGDTFTEGLRSIASDKLLRGMRLQVLCSI
jgi:hypothetical protein